MRIIYSLQAGTARPKPQEAIMHKCVVCGNNKGVIRVAQADRSSAKRGQVDGFICEDCNRERKASARNRKERGAVTVEGIAYRMTIRAEYDNTAKAELAKGEWLACDGAIKSPKLHNMKWANRKFDTLDRLISEGHITLTAPIVFSFIVGCDVRTERWDWQGKSDFMGRVRAIADPIKADLKAGIKPTL